MHAGRVRPGLVHGGLGRRTDAAHADRPGVDLGRRGRLTTLRQPLFRVSSAGTRGGIAKQSWITHAYGGPGRIASTKRASVLPQPPIRWSKQDTCRESTTK